ncbi:MAG: hypothetical protein HY782_13245 [Chloroflexi bacterium]|nr:hypothetical protein [Chloroflexota bacterium]
MASTSTTTTVYCTNHPNTETLLRCYRCGRPMCLRCLTRTPVGMICKECLGTQRAGYYNATPLDYALAAIVGFILSFIGGLIAALLGGLWFFAIFYAPLAGGIIAEGVRFVVRRHRGRYIALIACAMVVIGGFINIGGPTILLALLTGQFGFATRGLLNIGFWIYLVLATGTVYARLRA